MDDKLSLTDLLGCAAMGGKITFKSSSTPGIGSGSWSMLVFKEAKKIQHDWSDWRSNIIQYFLEYYVSIAPIFYKMSSGTFNNLCRSGWTVKSVTLRFFWKAYKKKTDIPHIQLSNTWIEQFGLCWTTPNMKMIETGVLSCPNLIENFSNGLGRNTI